MNQSSTASNFDRDPRAILSRFAYAVLAPIVKLFIRFGWSARDVADLVRWVFVKVFYSTPEFWRHGRPSAVQAAIKTGIPRAVVAQLSEIPEPELAMFTFRQNLAYRVIEGWVNDPEFQLDGQPRALHINNTSGPSFRKLVRRYGKDVTFTAVLGDLRDVGCVKCEGDLVTLVNQTYGVNFFDEDVLGIVAYSMNRLGDTIVHNIGQRDPEKKRVQRLWLASRIPMSALKEVTGRIEKEAVAAGRRIDSILTEYVHETRSENIDYVEVGVGTYVFVDEGVLPIYDSRPEDFSRRSKLK